MCPAYRFPSPRFKLGEGGIRTLGTLLGVRRFSKALLSTTQPPHQLAERIWQTIVGCQQHAQLRTPGLAILPFGLAFLDEGINSFLGIPRKHVLDHYLGGVAVGVLKPKFDLPIERFLADLDDVS